MESSIANEVEEDQALSDPVLGDLFAALRGAGSGPAPVIDDELRRAMNGLAATTRARRRRSLLRFGAAGLASAGVVAGGLTAAAANDLPAPVQRVVSGVVGRLTPFDLPDPDQHGPVQNQQDGPADSPGDQPGQDSQTPGTAHGPDEQGGSSPERGDNGVDETTDSGRPDADATGGGQDDPDQAADQGSPSDEPESEDSGGQSGGANGATQDQPTDGQPGSGQPPGSGAGDGDDGDGDGDRDAGGGAKGSGVG